jgi:hypothetical protein
MLVCMHPWGWWRSLGMTRDHRAILPDPLSVRYTISPALAGFSFMMPIWAFDNNPNLPLILAMPFLATGAMLALHSVFGREIGPPACPQCGYDIAGLDFPTPCPECGRNLLSIADATVITRVRRPNRIAAGIILFLIGIAIANLLPLERVHVVALLPLETRLKFAPGDRDAFETVANATLTEPQRQTLADAILDRRREGKPYRITPQIEWLADQFADQSLTPEQVQRFILEGTDPRLLAESPARVGQPIPLVFAIDTGRSRIGPVGRMYFIRSLTAGDQTLFQNRTTLGVPAYIFEPVSSRLPASIALLPPRPFHTYTPSISGPTTIRLETIVITTLGNAAPTITWHDDHTYTITPPPRTPPELTAETTLQVTP